jgi:hypothetical protein
MIVKVQTSIVSSGPAAALIYDKEQSFQLEVPVKEVEGVMKGRPKVFFHATIEGQGLRLGGEAPWQDW